MPATKRQRRSPSPSPSPSVGTGGTSDGRLSNEEIISIVADIRSYHGAMSDKIEEFTHKYKDFSENYPSLFEMACNDGFDVEKFNYMLRLRKQIETSERSVEDTSKEVGQKFYDIYMEKKNVVL